MYIYNIKPKTISDIKYLNPIIVADIYLCFVKGIKFKSLHMKKQQKWYKKYLAHCSRSIKKELSL